MAEIKSENKTGIIKLREPLLGEGGEQQTWESDNGLFYKWTIMIDGKTGTALSKDEQPWWDVGMSVSYTVETKKFRGEDQYSFKGLKKPDPAKAKDAHIKEAYSGKSAYNDPTLLHQTAMSKSAEIVGKYFLAIGYIPESPETVMSASDIFYDWIMKGVTDMHNFWIRRDAVLYCVEHLDHVLKAYPDDPADPAKKEKLTVKIFRYATELLKAPLAITKEVLDANLGGEKK